MTEDSFNWQQFKHAIILKTSPEDLFKYAATKSGLEKWFMGHVDFNGGALSESMVPAEGVNYDWKWLAKEFKSSGKVLRTDASTFIEYSFGGPFEIRFEVLPLETRSKLILTQRTNTDITADPFAYINCCVCWVFFLTNLKSVIENGIDLRETDISDEVLVNQ